MRAFSSALTSLRQEPNKFTVTVTLRVQFLFFQSLCLTGLAEDDAGYGEIRSSEFMPLGIEKILTRG